MREPEWMEFTTLVEYWHHLVAESRPDKPTDRDAMFFISGAAAQFTTIQALNAIEDTEKQQAAFVTSRDELARLLQVIIDKPSGRGHYLKALRGGFKK